MTERRGHAQAAYERVAWRLRTVDSIGGNDAIGVSGVIQEGAANVPDALEKLPDCDRFYRSYGTIRTVLERSLPAAFCRIYEPRLPNLRRRRAVATTLADCVADRRGG